MNETDVTATTTTTAGTAVPEELARLIAEAQARERTKAEAAQQAQAAREQQAQAQAMEALRETIRACLGERVMTLLRLDYHVWRLSDSAWRATADTWLGDYEIRVCDDGHAPLTWTAVACGARFMATNALEMGSDASQAENDEMLLRWLGRVISRQD